MNKITAANKIDPIEDSSKILLHRLFENKTFVSSTLRHATNSAKESKNQVFVDRFRQNIANRNAWSNKV